MCTAEIYIREDHVARREARRDARQVIAEAEAEYFWIASTPVPDGPSRAAARARLLAHAQMKLDAAFVAYDALASP
jgi:hypothetical protein